MKRWIVKAGSTSLDGLVREEVAMPEPGPGEVRVKVHAVSLNRRDHLLLTGAFHVAEQDFVPVSDGAGEIDALGAGVEGWSLGERVSGAYFPGWEDGPPVENLGWGLGSPGQDGLLAEYAILPAARLTRTPRTLSFDESATLPCAALTAWTALNGDRPYTDRVKAGDRVLVTGTGGVSLFALLFAKAVGASVVATTSDDRKADKVTALGGLGVVNYRHEANWGQVASERFGAFDRVVDAAGPGALDQSIAALAAGGEIALMGLYDFADTSPNFVALMMKAGSIRGTSVGSAAAYRDLAAFIDDHDIKPPIARTFAFDDAKAAYQAANAGGDTGKIVISID